jgi:hypothetical protein
MSSLSAPHCHDDLNAWAALPCGLELARYTYHGTMVHMVHMATMPYGHFMDEAYQVGTRVHVYQWYRSMVRPIGPDDRLAS